MILIFQYIITLIGFNGKMDLRILCMNVLTLVMIPLFVLPSSEYLLLFNVLIIGINVTQAYLNLHVSRLQGECMNLLYKRMPNSL